MAGPLHDDRSRSFRFLWRSASRIRRDIDDELRFHLDMRTAELIAAGMEEDEARREATREFGDIDHTRQYCGALDEGGERRDRRANLLAELRDDLRFAMRAAARRPMAALVAIITLALGVGANTAVFSVLRSVILRPLPFAEPQRLVAIFENNTRSGSRHSDIAPADFLDWRAAQRSFDGIAAFGWRSFTYAEGAFPEQLDARRVSANLFDVLGTRAAFGRTFRPGEDEGAHRVVVLTHGLWQRLFGADTTIVGRAITLSGSSYVVVGVLPREFVFPRGEPVLFTPIDFHAAVADPNRARRFHFLYAVGRLKRGTDVPQAAADLLAITRRLEREYPKDNAGHYATVESLDDALVGEVRPAILVLMGAATFVLLIACANVANLALSRALSRRREFGVRVALGASAGRILRQSLTESLFIALLGGACGYVVARLVTSGLLALYPGALPQTFTVQVDATALVFATTVSLLTGVFFGLAPALASSRNGVQHSLRDGARGSTHGREGIRLRRSLVVVQVALAIVLLVGCGLLARTLANLQSVELGFEPAQVTMVDVPLSGARYESRDAIISFWDALLERMRADRSFGAAAAGSAVPLWGGSGASLAIENRVVAGPLPEVRYYSVSDGYFEALGIGTAAGRLFTSADRATSPMVAVVNEAAARTFWPNEPVIGARIRLGPDPRDPWREIVGVVRDARFDRIDGPARPAAFVLHRQDAWNEMLVAVRSGLGAREVRDRVRVAVRDLDPAIAVNEAQTMEGVLGGELARRRFAMALLGAFAAIALALAVVGLYGVVAYGVTTRMQELGVRIALGARAEQIIGLVMGQGVGMAAIGLVFGTVGAAALSRLLRGLLYGVAPLDLATFAAAPALLLVATALACWVPARRASRVDPVEALRAE